MKQNVLAALAVWTCAVPILFRSLSRRRAVLAVVVALYAIDNCMNAMVDPIFAAATGGLAAFGAAERPTS